MRIYFRLLLIILLAMPASMSWAQFSDGTDIAVAPGFGENNPALRRLLNIQSQNQLLKKLIEREKSVNDMVKAAISVGVNSPFVPAPDLQICQQVPANIPCAQAYTSLYDDFSVAVKSPAASLPPPAPSIMENTDIPALSARDLSSLPDPVIAQSQIYWTDITCLGTKCSAVISPNPQDPAARYRIVAGEKLPDGSIVSAISAGGVTLERDKKSIQLEPAPSA